MLLGMFEVFQFGVACHKVGVKELNDLQIEALHFYLMQRWQYFVGTIKRSQPELFEHLIEWFSVWFYNVAEVEHYHFFGTLLRLQFKPAKLRNYFNWRRFKIQRLWKELRGVIRAEELLEKERILHTNEVWVDLVEEGVKLPFVELTAYSSDDLSLNEGL